MINRNTTSDLQWRLCHPSPRTRIQSAGGGHVTTPIDVMWSQVPHWWWCSTIDITNEYNEHKYRDNIARDRDI